MNARALLLPTRLVPTCLSSALLAWVLCAAAASAAAAPAAGTATAALPSVVYVPYDRTPQLAFDTQGVFLPYAKFLALWDAAQAKPDQAAKPPPIGATLTAFTLTGAVLNAGGNGGNSDPTGESAVLTLHGQVAALAKDWSSVTLPAQLALSGFAPEAGSRVLAERTADAVRLHLPGPGTAAFTAQVHLAVTRDASGRRSLVIPVPAAAAGRLDLRLPGREADVTLSPGVAAAISREADATRVQAVLGAATSLTLSWQPPAAAVTGAAMLLSSSDLLLTVAERSLRTDLALQITVLRRPQGSFRISLPSDAQVLEVTAPGLRGFDRTQSGVTVHLHEAIEGSLRVVLRCERLLPALRPGSSRSVVVAWPHLEEAVRSTGAIAIVQGEALAVAIAEAEGLVQIDPATLERRDAVAAFRFHAAPPQSTLTALALEPDVRCRSEQLLRLGSDEDRLAVLLSLDVRKAGIFSLAVEVPAAFEVADHRGLALDEVRRSDPYPDPQDPAQLLRRLDLSLRGRLLGEAELELRLRAAPSLSGQTAPGSALRVMPLHVPSALSQRGSLVVAVPRSIALTLVDRSGLNTSELEPLRRTPGFTRLGNELGVDDEPALGLAFLSQSSAAAASVAPSSAATSAAALPRPHALVDATRRARELALRCEEQLVLVDGQLRRNAIWRGDVRFSALASLRIDAPTDWDDRLTFKGIGPAALADRRIVERHPATATHAATTTWELRFQTPVLGAFTLSAEGGQALPALTPGHPVSVVVPPLIARDATRSSAVIAIAQHGTLDVQASAAGMDALPSAELPASMQGAGIVAAFQAQAHSAVTLALTRHDLVRQADAAVLLARYHAVIGDDGIAQVRGVLHLASRGRPYLELRLPSGATLLETAIDRRPGRPSRRSDGAVILPLPTQSGDVLIAFAYQQPVADGRPTGSGGLDLALPRIASSAEAPLSAGAAAPALPQLPIGRCELTLWLPAELRLTSFGSAFASDPAARAQPSHADVGLTMPLTVPAGSEALHLLRLGDGGAVQLRFVATSTLRLTGLAAAAALIVAVFLLRRRAALIGALILATTFGVLIADGPWRDAVEWAAGGLGFGVLFVLLLAALRLLSATAQRRSEHRQAAQRDAERSRRQAWIGAGPRSEESAPAGAAMRAEERTQERVEAAVRAAAAETAAPGEATAATLAESEPVPPASTPSDTTPPRSGG